MDDLDFIKKHVGLKEGQYSGRDPNVSMPRETMDRILEAMEAAMHEIERPTGNQKSVVKALQLALSLIDPHHSYKE